MERNMFRDYCKAENSEDEEVNCDLQSQLYAGIYYGPSDIESIDKKPNIKFEPISIDYENLQKDEGVNKIPTLTCNLKDDNYSSNPENSIDSSGIAQTDDKSYIKSIVINETEARQANVDNKNDLNIPSVNSMVHSKDNVESIQNVVQSTICYTTDSVFDLNDQNIPITEKEIDIKCKETIKSMNSLSSEIPVIQSSHFNNSIEEKQELAYTETKLNDDGNIFKKYEFSKNIINQLYLKKYTALEKELKEIEEEKERRFKEALREEEKERRLKEAQREESNNKRIEDDERVIDMDSKYEIRSTIEKGQETSSGLEEIVLSTDSESDSEESILEVPIPPKPQPPVINLNDSDESSESSSSSDSDIDDKRISVTEDMNHTLKGTNSQSYKVEKPSNSKTSDDIVLNCTEIQKCASSIQEIMKTSKNVQSESQIIKSQVDTSCYPFNDNENKSEFHVPPTKIVDSNVVYERDKNVSIDFTKDVSFDFTKDVKSNFLDAYEPTLNKKRHRESDDESCNNVEKSETSNESKRPKINSDEHIIEHMNNPHRKQYFFPPMSDELKAFYNEPRGQENFDIREIQNKMSKDPRLWNILDEDLIPELAKRNRYWNSKCGNCHYRGHQRHNCPETHKTPRCHMCGNEGHTETRCPNKMCLTCGKKQGTFRKTCESCRTLYCDMCKAVGHKPTECPDLWRRFHQTTRNSEIDIPANLSEVMKPADLLYCCNCTKRGHDSSTCNEYRWSQHFPTPAYVSSYTDGPKYEKSKPAASNKGEDIIPLSTKKKQKPKVPAEGQDDLSDSFVVYSYGSCHLKEPNVKEIKKPLEGDMVRPSHLTELLKGSVTPHFLDKLKTMVPFEIKIYNNPKQRLYIRIRSAKAVTQHLSDIFLFWLKLTDEDKRLDVYVNFPRNRSKLTSFLATKLHEIETNSGDPNYVYSYIKKLKTTMSKSKNPEAVSSITREILNLRGKLMKMFHSKPNTSAQLKKFKKVIHFIKKREQDEITVSIFFKLVCIYNKLFLPRELSEVEFNRLRRHYEKVTNRIKSKEDQVEKSKKMKKYKNPYDTFLENVNYNKLNAKINSDSTESCENQNQQIPVITSVTTENIIVTNSVQCKNSNIATNVNVPSTVYSTEHVQLSCNTGASSNRKAKHTVNKDNLITVQTESKVIVPPKTSSLKHVTSDSTNLITVPLTESFKNQEKKKQSGNVLSSDITISEGNAGTSTQLIQGNTGATEISDTQQNTAVNTASVTKSKSRKKRSRKSKSALKNTQAVQVVDPITLENKAKTVIDIAIGFNLPHMNKAVEEIQKKINDKKLKQEHIDVLQRLINLEKDHQKYVNSFCNFLQ